MRPQEKAEIGFGTTGIGKDAFGAELVERPRATTEEALNPKQYRKQALSKEETQYVGDSSWQAGALAAAGAASLSGGAIYLANTFSPKFRGALGISGKMALVVTPTAGAFFLKSYQTVAEARADPDAFVAGREAAAAAAPPPPPQYQLSTWQSACNMVYFHPFKVIGAIALPSYIAAFYRESTHPSTAGMLLSQRIIHTRVCARRRLRPTSGLVYSITPYA